MSGPRCQACGATREPADLAVARRDVSRQFELEPGSVVRFVSHCADRLACRVDAQWIAERFPGGRLGRLRTRRSHVTERPFTEEIEA